MNIVATARRNETLVDNRSNPSVSQARAACRNKKNNEEREEKKRTGKSQWLIYGIINDIVVEAKALHLPA